MASVINRVGRAVMSCYPFPRGQGRIVDRTFLGRLRFEEPTLLVRTADGFDIRVMPNDHIGRHIYLTGQFDRTVVEVLLAHAREGDGILDIGANIGYVSCSLLHALPSCRVASVEPNPACFALLEENVRRVGPGRSTAVCAAVSDAAGVGVLAFGGENSGQGHLVAAAPRTGLEATVEVPLITGEELVRRSGLERIDAIKIDVEGHEGAVLRTLRPVLEAHRPRIVLFEHHARLEEDSPLVREIFAPAGYEVLGLVKSLTRWRLVPIGPGGGSTPATHDYAAVPAGGRGSR